MSLSRRVTVGMLALVALLAAVEAARQAQLKRLYREARALATVDLEVSRSALRMRRHLAAIDNFGRKFVLLGADSAYAGELTRLRRQVGDELDLLAALELTEGERRAAVRLSTAWSAYAADAVAAQDAALEGRPVDLTARLVAPLSGFEERVAALEVASREATRARVAAGAAEVEGARTAAWVAAAVALGAAVLTTLAIGRWIGGPVERLAAATREVATGDFTVRAPVEGSAEVASLAADFNQMIDRLGELDRLKRGFVSAVSHDLKAPLASIDETLRLVLDQAGERLSTTERELLELSLESNGRLREMIGDLLDLARLDAGVMRFELQPHDLAELAAEAVTEARVLAGAGRPSLELRRADRPLPVEADRQPILQALRNLLSNAVAFGAEGGQVEVIAAAASDTDELATAFRDAPADAPLPAAWVEVDDRGPGVPETDREAIFEPFRQVESGRRNRRGSGLGLAIARGIVAGHGGRLWVEDRPLGGSRFVLLLPMASPDAPRRRVA